MTFGRRTPESLCQTTAPMSSNDSARSSASLRRISFSAIEWYVSYHLLEGIFSNGIRANSSWFTGKVCPQLRDGETAVRDAVLLVRGQLGHRAAVAGDHEERVVAEALLATRC
jgi:hypothetical protein